MSIKYYKRVDQYGNTRTVESYSHDQNVPGATEIEKTEYDAYILSLPVPIPEPERDIPAEIDQIKAILAANNIK